MSFYDEPRFSTFMNHCCYWWIMERKRFRLHTSKENALRRFTFTTKQGVISFVILLVLLAYLEEGLWDGFVWREHLSFFTIFKYLPTVKDNVLMALLVPLLALPQSTHYVLDGFIWKIKRNKEF